MDLLLFLLRQPPLVLWVIFLLENFSIALLSILLGRLIAKRYGVNQRRSSAHEYRQCAIIIVVNTVITYFGFYLFHQGIINFVPRFHFWAIIDFIILFVGMDLLMFVFHYIIHHTPLYKSIHGLHHQYSEPSPIDLYVLHPLEAVGFGGLWLVLLCIYSFNFYAVVAYLTANVVFGIVGHLGFDPLPAGKASRFPFKYLGTSTFHHNHHQHLNHNYGFYTVFWDKLFGTYKSG